MDLDALDVELRGRVRPRLSPRGRGSAPDSGGFSALERLTSGPLSDPGRADMPKAFPTRTLIRATRDGYQLWELPGPGIGHVPTYRVEQDDRLVGEFPTPAAAATARSRSAAEPAGMTRPAVTAGNL